MGIMLTLKVVTFGIMVTKSDQFWGFDKKKNPASIEKQLLAGFGCTRNRGRTGTGITAHRILSPACLPIPPSEPYVLRKTLQM